jgi:hypothetical protein
LQCDIFIGVGSTVLVELLGGSAALVLGGSGPFALDRLRRRSISQ